MNKRYAREDLKDAIVYAVLHIQAHGKHATPYAVARHLGFKPGGHINSCLWELVDDGRVIMTPHSAANLAGVRWTIDVIGAIK